MDRWHCKCYRACILHAYYKQIIVNVVIISIFIVLSEFCSIICSLSLSLATSTSQFYVINFARCSHRLAAVLYCVCVLWCMWDCTPLFCTGARVRKRLNLYVKSNLSTFFCFDIIKQGYNWKHICVSAYMTKWTSRFVWSDTNARGVDAAVATLNCVIYDYPTIPPIHQYQCDGTFL